ncbi:MAG: DUF362 domain-containing protein [Desulfobulbaceae bacterium]|jgi:uncharacterized protein (DUF362 family)/ferredoxin|nr:DUF362 domain-containing protein [Desulfobulbaceae bacterium]
MQKVMIHPASYQACQAAVDRAFELFPVAITGRKVLIKPNVLRAAAPEEAITTHPAVLAAVVRAVEARNPAAIVVGDNGGLMAYGANEASFEQCCLTAASLGHYKNIGLEAVEMPFDQAYGGKVSISKDIAEADVFISLPKFKTHGLTCLSGAIKNSYGLLLGAQKAQFHELSGGAARFHDMLPEVYALRVPDIIIMDAVLGMQGNGPASTELRYIGRILASDNGVALDAVVARMMGVAPAKLGFLLKAKAMGLGDYRDESIALDGTLLPIPDFKTPPLDQNDIMAHRGDLESLVNERLTYRPLADPEKCSGCGVCVEQCPEAALAFAGPTQALAFANNGVPVVDAEACIACYCCQEMCPEKAMTLQAPKQAATASV